MSDPADTTDQLVKVATHAGAGGLGGVIIGLWNKWRADRREEKLETILNGQNVQLALMAQTLKDLAAQLEKHDKVFSDVVETKLMVTALHRRVDDLEKRRGR